MGEGTGGEQGARGLGDEAAGEALAAADGDRGANLAATVRGGQVVGDVEADGGGGHEREAPGLALVALDVKADTAAGEAAGHASARAGRQPRGVEIVDFEGNRGPTGHRVGVGEEVEYGFGAGVDDGGGRPGLHGAEPSQ